MNDRLSDDLLASIAGTVATPDAPGYDDATSPLNTTARQRPRIVVRAGTADDVAAAMRVTGDHGVGVTMQATGHGAAGVLGDDIVLIDVGALDEVEIDPERRRARVGGGARWESLTAAAAAHGLVGLAGTAPSVGVAGYTFQGGVGWTVRAHGLASARLVSVEYVDASGTSHRADAERDPDALWAFRGGFGVGIATTLEIELLPHDGFWAGFFLFAADDMPMVAEVWSQATDGLDPAISTILGMMKAAPPVPAVAEKAQGRPVTYLGLCSTDQQLGERLTDELRAALPRPLTDAVGSIHATDLGAIHLDPTFAVPALGEGRYLSGLEDSGTAILAAGAIGSDGPLGGIEMRHVAPGSAPAVDGAAVSVPGPFLYHAVGEAADDDARAAVDQQLRAVREAARPVDLNRSPAGFRDGYTDAFEALAVDEAARLAQLLTERDPAGRFRLARPVVDR